MSGTSDELETMRPNPVWTSEAYEDALTVWRELANEVTVKVWGGDWCKDCRSQLPDFSAGLQAAGVERVEHYPVETDDDGAKTGPQVDTYDIERIPTIIVEHSGEEVGRFVEEATFPIFVALAEELDTHL